MKRKRLYIVILISAVFAILLITGALYSRSFMAGLYEPVPVEPIGNRKATVLCLGDSITHGNVSASYIDLLEQAFDGESLRFVNGGINGDMVHNVSSRLDQLLVEVGTVQLVTLLIGTNDANATLDDNVARRALENPDYAETPSIRTYRRDLTGLVDRIRQKTGAPVILISIPPMGERIGSPEWSRSKEFAGVSREISGKTESSYLPFFEAMEAEISANPADSSLHPEHRDWYRNMVLALIRRHFLDMDYTAIGAIGGYRFHSDQLHLNEAGAEVLATLLEPEIRRLLE